MPAMQRRQWRQTLMIRHVFCKWQVQASTGDTRAAQCKGASHLDATHILAAALRQRSCHHGRRGIAAIELLAAVLQGHLCTGAQCQMYDGLMGLTGCTHMHEVQMRAATVRTPISAAVSRIMVCIIHTVQVTSPRFGQDAVSMDVAWFSPRNRWQVALRQSSAHEWRHTCQPRLHRSAGWRAISSEHHHSLVCTCNLLGAVTLNAQRRPQRRLYSKW